MRLVTVTDGHGSAYVSGQSVPRVKPVGVLAAVQSEQRDAHPDSRQERARFLQSRATHQQSQQSQYQLSGEEPQQRGRMIYAHELMTSPVAMISPNDSLNHVWTLMCQHRFRHMPVSEDGVHLKGMLSDRDLLQHAPDITGKVTTRSQPAEYKTVSQIMTRVVLAAYPDIEIREVARTMFKERIGCLPLLDPDGKVVGIITRSDILRVVMNNAPLDLWS